MYPHNKQAVALAIQSFVTENKLEEKELPLKELRRLPASNQVSIVFDGNRVLDDVVQEVQVTAPLTIFTASTPWAAYTVISEYTEMVRKLGEYFNSMDGDFKPMFVFNGCGFVPMEDQDTTSPAPPIDVASYNAYNKNKTVASVPADVQRKFAARYAVEEDVEGLIVRKMCEVAEETLRAPYLAWSQVSAFFAPSNTMASEAYGSLELLAFPGIDRVITKINVENGTFNCVSKAAVMSALRRRYDAEFSEDEFSAIVLYDSKNRLFHVKNRRDSFDDFCRLPRDPTRIDTFMKLQRISEEHKVLMRRNFAALEAPVFTVDAQLVPLSMLYNLPRRCEIRRVFGSPMPTIFFYLFMSGPLLPLPFAIHSQEVLADDWPLIDTSAYRRAAESILPLRVQVVFQLFPIAPKSADFYWIRQYVVVKKQPQGADSQSRVCKLCNPPTIDLAYWRFDENLLLQSTRDAENVYFNDIVPFCGCAVADQVVYKSVQATLAAVYLRSLDFLGYFTHATDGAESSGPSVYCKALERFDCPTLSEYGVLMIELMRTGTLNDDPLVVVLNRVDESIPMGVRFASRLVSIIPANVSGPWSGPFDPEMAAFGVISRLFGRTLRILHEVIAMLLFANRVTTVPWDQFHTVVQCLPFHFPSECSAGFLMTYVLCNPQCTMEELSSTFREMYALETDLQTLFWFFTMGFEAIRVINYEEPLSDEMVQVVNAARQHVGQACARLCPDVYAAHFPAEDIGYVAPNPAMEMGTLEPQMEVPMPMNNMHAQMPNNMNMNMNVPMHPSMNANMMQYQQPRMY